MDKDKPDYEIEKFWLGLKQSMINFYGKSNIRPISYWSDKLNLLQKERKYDNIEKNIRNYISLYGIDVMKKRNEVALHILKTNIKRWSKITEHYDFIRSHENYYNIIFLLIDIFDNLYKNLPSNDFDILYQQIELIIIYNDFEDLIKLCIKHDIGKVIDKINLYIDVESIVNNIYNIKLPKQISGNKMIKLIKKL
jgi:hypothetical protein